MEKELTAKDACAIADLTLKNKACGIPENLIISSDKEKIREYILALIQKAAMRGEYYLPLYISGSEAKKTFMCVVDELSINQNYSFMIVESKNSIMIVTVIWKGSWNKDYDSTIKKLFANI